jgi:hypothetical protein
MTLVDIKLTQGSYWKGAQLPYWVYMVVVVLIGGLGLDHLLLRSPLTFLMKLLIPTLGFWYLYDIAQVFGERELVEKYGLGVPWYGPIGLGAGMFINKDASNLSPPTIPKPWIFMAYALLSIFFFIIPLNKVLIGDYAGCIAQLSMYTILALFSLGVTAILAVCWGIYDAFRVVFDTKGLFEKGAARVFPATWIMDPYFNKGALGPEMAPVVKSDENKGIISKIINYVIGVYTFGPRMALAAATSTAKLATNTASSTVKEVASVAGDAVKEVTDTAANTVKGLEDTVVQKGENTVKAINTATGGLASRVINKAEEKVGSIGGKLTNVVKAKANEIEERVDTSINKAVEKGVNSVVDRITSMPDKAATAVDALGKVATIEADAALAAVQTVTAATDIAKAGPKVLGKVADKLTDPAVQDQAVDSVVDNFLPAAASGIMGKFIPTAPVPGTPAANTASAAAAAATAAAAAAPAAATAAAVQKGGAILASSSDPAFSSAVLIFSVALLAFGGYVMYSFRKAADLNRNDRPDDSPPDAEPVRGSPKAKRA